MKVHGIGKQQGRTIAVIVGLVLAGSFLASCGSEQAGPARQAPPVTVDKPLTRTIQEYAIFTGSSRAVASADVVARVAGTLQTVEFEPSSVVSAGDLLFTIEATRYRALRDAARAALQSAQADLLRAEAELQRVEKASRSRAVSEMDVDRSRADRDMAKARVGSARASLDEAELNLSYTRVVAPIDGIVNRNQVDAGNLVGQGGPTLLTRVNKMQPIYVYFNAPESVVLHFLSMRKEIKERDIQQGGEIEARVELANETGFPHTGVIDYVDNEVDPRTGTIEMRVRLENENNTLFPGLFVRVKASGPDIPGAVLVPERAIGSDLGGRYVLTVGENNIVTQTYVTLGLPQGDGTVHVMKGLAGDETIIVNGLMFARPGAPVTPLTAEQFKAMQQKRAAKG
jgi:RND family efflux transporter MFP subunit